MISWRTILLGAATRFAGGIGAFLAGSFLLAAVIKGITIERAQVIGFSELILALTAGYVVTLGLLRPALQSDAGIEGRRSVIAGLGATCVYLYMGVLHAGPMPHLLRDVFAVAAGSITTLVVFFPWLGRRRNRPGNDDGDALLGEGDLLDLRGDMATRPRTAPITPREL